MRYLIASLAILAMACVTLTASDRALIAADAAAIARCQALGLACKSDGGEGCYSLYDECMRDGGLR